MIDKIESLIRRGTILGVMVTALASSSLIHPKALALPTEQISQKLNSVRIFFIGEHTGNIAYRHNEKDRQQQLPIFISRQEANKVLAITQKQNPLFARKLQVYHRTLGNLLQLARKQGYKMIYVPNAQAVNDAKAIVGEQYREGVPLFVGRIGNGNNYLTTTENSRRVVPIFF